MPKKLVLRTLLAAGLAATITTAAAESGSTLQIGNTAPPELVEKAQQTAPVRIGKQYVRPVSEDADPSTGLAALSSFQPTKSSTLVIRESDNMVGVSHHELSVRGANPNEVTELTRSLSPTASTRSFPQLDITVIRVPSFADLGPLAEQLNESLPNARIDLPVQWAPYQLR